MAARMFQLMKYSNKDFLRVIIIVVDCNLVVSPWEFESTFGGSLVPFHLPCLDRLRFFYECFELGHVKGRNFCRNF